MRKHIFLAILVLTFGFTIVSPFTAHAALGLRLAPAAPEKEEANAFAAKAGFKTDVTGDTAYALVSTLINTFLGLLGVLFLLLIIYGGFKWMSAQGAEEEVTKAKNILTQASIGLVIIMAAYAISAFVIGSIQSKTLKTGQQSVPPNSASSGF